MKKYNTGFSFILIFLLLGQYSHGQETKDPGKNIVAFNLTGCFINELNIGVERYLNRRKILELNAGIIFVNNFLKDQTDDWKNSQVFIEHGYAVRLHYKVFSQRDETIKKWRNYISTGILYKHLYYNEQWFTNELTDSRDKKYTESLFQKRTRTKVGIEFLWGKMYEMNRTFSFDFFYGGGIVANDVNRTILKKIPDSRVNEIIDVNETAKSFYIRPYVVAGIKIKIRF